MTSIKKKSRGVYGRFAFGVLISATLLFVSGCESGKYTVDIFEFRSDWPVVVWDGPELKRYPTFRVGYDLDSTDEAQPPGVGSVLSDYEWARGVKAEWPRGVKDLAELGSPGELLAEIPWYRRIRIYPRTPKSDDVDHDRTLSAVVYRWRGLMEIDKRVWILSLGDPLAIAVEESAPEGRHGYMYWGVATDGTVCPVDDRMRHRVTVSEVIWTWDDLESLVADESAGREVIIPDATRLFLDEPESLAAVLARRYWLSEGDER